MGYLNGLAATLLLACVTFGNAAVGANGKRCKVEENRVPLMQAQLVGAHNSYHLAPSAAQRALYARTEKPNGSDKEITDLMHAVNYESPPLSRQLQHGVRMFELDLYMDPEGGRFAEDGVSIGLSAERLELLRHPGIKVFHAPGLDMGSSCMMLRSCLEQIAEFHRENSKHLPIFILIEPKSQDLANPEAWAIVVDEIRANFDAPSILFPSSVRRDGGRASWPTVGESRGKIVPMLFDYDPLTVEAYARFAAARPADDLLHLPIAAAGLSETWKRHSNPDPTDVAASRALGLLTYAKSDTMNVLEPQRVQRTISSGANLVSTDYLDWNGGRKETHLSLDGRYFRVRNPCEP